MIVPVKKALNIRFPKYVEKFSSSLQNDSDSTEPTPWR
jgi:hypothetical protein